MKGKGQLTLWEQLEIIFNPHGIEIRVTFGLFLDGTTALHVACQYEHKQAIIELLKNKVCSFSCNGNYFSLWLLFYNI